MITVNGNDIAITREDDLRLLVRVAGTADPLTDTVLFTVKSNPRSEEKLIEKEFMIQQDAYGDLFVEVILSHEDTDRPPRVYWWDLRVIHHVGAEAFLVETPMSYAAFEITDVIGDPENGPGPEPPQPVPIPEVVWTVNGLGPDENGNVNLGGIVYSVNHALPDESGNVQIDGGGTVKSVNGTEPDEYGDVAISIPTKTSELENDSGFLTEHQSLSAYRTAVAQDMIDAGKAAAVHTHAQTDISGLGTALAGKVNEPDTEGADGQVLATDGSGGRSWVTVSGGTGDYESLSNKPSVGGHTLKAGDTLTDIGAADATTVAQHGAILQALGTAANADTGTGAGDVPVLGAAVTGGGLAKFDENGAIVEHIGSVVTAESGNVGSTVHPVYLADGVLTAGNSYADEFVVDNKSITGVSVAANTAVNIYSVDLTKSGYTPIAIAGWSFESGTNFGSLVLVRAYISGNNLPTVVRNTTSSAASNVTLSVYVLYRKNN